MYSTEAIILKKIDSGETDTLYSLYTKDFGKIRALAKGIKKESAKLKGHLEPLSVSRIGFVLGKTGERLTHATLLRYHAGIRREFEKEIAARYVAGLVDEVCLLGEKDEQIWRELLSFLETLDKSAGLVFQDFIAGFETRFLDVLGYNGERDIRVLGVRVENPFLNERQIANFSYVGTRKT